MRGVGVRGSCKREAGRQANALTHCVHRTRAGAVWQISRPRGCPGRLGPEQQQGLVLSP